MKDFADFRNNWITEEKEEELIERSFVETKVITGKSDTSTFATFSATYSLLLFAEYHEWLNQ